MQGSATELVSSTSMEEATQVTERTVDSEELAGLIRAAVQEGNTISFNAPGSSMIPFVQSGDKVFIAPVAKAAIRRGDVLAFVRPNDHRLLIHRVIRIDGGEFFMKGDNVPGEGDGWISFSDVLGRVAHVEQNGKDRDFGLGSGRLLIAQFSRWKILVRLLNFLRRIKRGLERLDSARG